MDSNFGKEALLEVVDNQIKDSNPTIVKETLMRLMMTGHSREEAMDLIACAMSVELLTMIHQEEVFCEERYGEMLKQLPDLSFMGEE